MNLMQRSTPFGQLWPLQGSNLAKGTHQEDACHNLLSVLDYIVPRRGRPCDA